MAAADPHPINKKTIFLIRHGESEDNVRATQFPDRPEQDFVNTKLTPLGREQAAAIKGPCQLLMISPLRRTLETYAFSGLTCAHLEVSYLCREWLGWGPSQYLEGEDQSLKESWSEFQLRMDRLYTALSMRVEDHITIVCHNGVIGQLSKKFVPGSNGEGFYNGQVKSFDVVFQ